MEIEEYMKRVSSLSGDELKVYKYALGRGYITESMAAAAGLKSGAVLLLENKKLLIRIPGIVPRYIPFSPIRGYLSDLKSFADKFTVLYGDLEKFARNFSTEIENKSKLLEDSIKESIEIPADFVSKQKEELEKKFAELTENISNKFGTAMNSYISDISGITGEGIGGLNRKIEKKVKEARDSFTEKRENAVISAEERKEIYISELNNTFSELKETKKRFSEKITGLRDYFEDTVQKTTNNFLDNLIKTVSEAGSSIKNDVYELSGSLTKVTGNILGVFEKKIEENGKHIIGKVTDELQSDITGRLTDISESIKDTIRNSDNAIGANLKDMKKNIEIKIKTLKTDTEKKIDKMENETVSKSAEFFNGVSSELGQNHGEWMKNIIGHLDKTIDILRNGASELKSVISETVRKEIEHYKNRVAETLNIIMEDYLNRIGEAGKIYEDTFKEAINDKLVEIVDGLRKTSFAIGKEGNEITERQLENFGKIEEKLRGRIKELITDLKDRTSAIYTEISGKAIEDIEWTVTDKWTGLKSGIDKLLTEIDEKKKNFGEDITNILTELKNELESGLKSLEKARSGGAEELKNRIERFGSELTGRLGEIIDKTASELKNSVENTVNEVKDTLGSLTTAVEEYGKKMEDITPDIVGVISDVITPLSQITDTFFNETVSIIEEITGYISGSLGDMREENTKKLRSELSDFSEKFNTIMTESRNSVYNLLEKLPEFARNASKVLEKTAGDISSELRDKFGTVIGEIENLEKIGKKFKEATETVSELLGDVWSLFVESALFDAEKTWIITGDKYILKYMDETIKRTKSNIFIMTPRISDLDLKRVSEIHKKGRKVMIVSDLETLDMKKLNRLYGEGIELYHYPDKDFMAFTRDGEEILIAPISPKEDETVAVISEVEPMIKHLHTMFMDYWRRKAKKYSPSG